MIAAMVFLGVQMFTAPQRANQDTRSAADIWSEMQTYNAELKDFSFANLLPKYESKVSEEAGKSNAEADKLSDSAAKEARKAEIKKETDEKILSAYTLYSDTAIKSATYREELFKQGKAQTNYGFSKLSRAFEKFKPKFEAFSKADSWNVPVQVAPYGTRVATSVTPASTYDDMVKTLSPMAQAEPVWGFIPGYQLIDALVKLTGSQPWISYTFAAFLLALVIRAIIWPLAQKQLMWGRQMQQLQPYVKEIQAKYQKNGKNLSQQDQMKMQAEMMDVYKQYGFNPLAGCWPALIQFPLFITVYQCMLHYKFEFTKGFFLWVHPGATTFLGIPLAPNLGEKDYILIVLYMASMIVSQMLMPVSDPTNYKQQKLMGVGVSVLATVFMFFYSLPSAFILYWIFTNVLSTVQSLLVYRMPAPKLEKVATSAGGVIPGMVVEDGKPTNGYVDPGFFGKTGTPKANKSKKKKR